MLRLALYTTLAALTSTPVLAHHGMTTKFNPEHAQTVVGTVSRVDWAFPHVHVFMLVEADGETLPWYIELESPQLLELNGWTTDTLQAGQQITVQGFRARDDSRQVWGESITVDASGAAVFTLQYASLYDSITTESTEPAPRWPAEQARLAATSRESGYPQWPDNQIRLGAPPGAAGYWVPETSVLREDGVSVEMLPNGQLINVSEAARVAPLQDWALALYQQRQENFLRSDPGYRDCRPPAGPRKFLDPYGIQLLEDRPLQRVFVVAGGGNHDWHLIYTDGRPLDGEEFFLDAGNLLYYGRNSAHWEGDTFIIESEGYNEKFWLPGGLPHSEQMHVTERLTRVDYGTLHYELTIDDPATYTRPWSASWNLRWLEGSDPPEHYCQDNRL